MSEIHDQINQRAFSTYSDKIEKEEMMDWLLHWFKTARLISEEYRMAGNFPMKTQADIAYRNHLERLDPETQQLINKSIHNAL